MNYQHFTEIENGTDSLILKIEKDTNNTLLKMKKQELISNKINSKLRTTGAQPAGLYDLAEVHKNEITLRPVLSIPGSNYYIHPC